MRIKQKNLFLFTFGITLIARAMTWHEFTAVPYTAIYITFCGFWGFMALIDSELKIRIPRDPASKALLMLALYYVIWGLANIKNLDFTDTIGVMLRSVLMVVFIAISCYQIKRYDCVYDTITTAYVALSALMLISFLLNLKDIDIASTISTFWISEEQFRYRTHFGFYANNIAAEYAMSVILLSITAYKKQGNNLNSGLTLRNIFLIIVDIIMVIVIIANNSRGTTIALLVMLLIYALLKAIKKYSIQRVIKLMIVIVVAVFVGINYYSISNGMQILDLLANANRAHFMDNIAILQSSGRWLMGLGRISGSYFKGGHYLYGIQTNYMEMFYVGVFVTSGIIGSIWIMYIIFTFLKSIYKVTINENSRLGKWILLVFYYMMFLSLFEEYLFSYSYITSTFFLMIIIAYIQINFKK